MELIERASLSISLRLFQSEICAPSEASHGRCRFGPRRPFSKRLGNERNLQAWILQAYPGPMQTRSQLLRPVGQSYLLIGMARFYLLA